jgi:hypothetical protein
MEVSLLVIKSESLKLMTSSERANIAIRQETPHLATEVMRRGADHVVAFAPEGVIADNGPVLWGPDKSGWNAGRLPYRAEHCTGI